MTGPNLKNTAIDSSAADDGRWIEFQAIPGAKIKIRPLLSPAVRKMVRTINGDLDPEERRLHILTAAVADWEGFVDVDDQPLAFSSDMVLSIMQNENNVLFTEFVDAHSSRLGEYVISGMENDAKNSSTLSSGGDAGERTTTL